MPDEDSRLASMTWEGFHQLVYTNFPEFMWRDHRYDFAIRPYEKPELLRSFKLATQLVKYHWQFSAVVEELNHHGVTVGISNS